MKSSSSKEQHLFSIFFRAKFIQNLILNETSCANFVHVSTLSFFDITEHSEPEKKYFVSEILKQRI